ncbi:hypothetical protein ABIE64_002669 [Thalassospira sp. MBR-102]|jgi:hypothetical protein|uniref:hypothetical protein n=1 Tax=Thalassospira sp. MBR-102 TaxID=3156466 RepID=UPI003397D642
MLYCIITGGEYPELDQVVETKTQAEREKRDLIKLGCEVKIKAVADWDAANELEEKLRSY